MQHLKYTLATILTWMLHFVGATALLHKANKLAVMFLPIVQNCSFVLAMIVSVLTIRNLLKKK